MKEEKKQKKRPRVEVGPDIGVDESLVWSKSQWRQFITIFVVMVICGSGIFWIFLIRQEAGIQRYYAELSRQFDQEWSYLQKLSRIQQVQRLSAQEGSKEAVFDGQKLNISFLYPKSWGEFEESKPLTYHMSVRLKRGTLEKVIGAYNEIPPLGFIAGWDTTAVGIWTPDDVEKVCERNTLADTCLTLTTRSGIRYARIRYANFLEVRGAVQDVVIYVFVNPSGEFPATALSNIGLRKSFIPHRISDMDAVMESIVFKKL